MSIIRNAQRRLRREVAESQELPSRESNEHSPNYLIDLVKAMDTKPEANRGGRGYIHGSSLIGLCPRKYALQILSGTTGRRPVREADRIMWAIGRAVEAHIRKQFISAVGRKGVFGKWVCRCGHLKRSGDFSNRNKCRRCGKSPLEYKELELFDHDFRIVGNPDMLYSRPDNALMHVVEIKSKKKELFEELEEPEPDHILQASIYRRLGAISGMGMSDEVSIIYGCKDYPKWGVRPYKEFHVQPSSSVESQLDDMWERAGQVRDFLAEFSDGENRPPLPERITACDRRDSTIAKGCEQCQACFAHEG